MLSKKDNFLETIRGGKPDRFVKQYEATVMLPGDPVCNYVRGNRHPGMDPLIDKWGTTIIWPADEPAAIPDPLKKLFDDASEWKDYVKVPDLIANCDASELWEPFLERVAKVDRSEQLVMMFAPTGVFERMHFLMGFEDMFVNFMVEPEAMKELAEAIGEYRYNGFKLMVEHVHPDVMLSHDDWGSKTQLFLRPELWRDIIKPAYVKQYQYLHDNGVIIMHHADSYCQDIVEDMVDLHIDIWQGCLAQNDIPAIQKVLNGRMTLMGGLDTVAVDRDNSTEEEVRAETRRVCKEYAVNGHFIPCITYGGPGAFHPQADIWIDDEIDRCSEEFFSTGKIS